MFTSNILLFKNSIFFLVFVWWLVPCCFPLLFSFWLWLSWWLHFSPTWQHCSMAWIFSLGCSPETNNLLWHWFISCSPAFLQSTWWLNILYLPSESLWVVLPICFFICFLRIIWTFISLALSNPCRCFSLVLLIYLHLLFNSSPTTLLHSYSYFLQLTLVFVYSLVFLCPLTSLSFLLVFPFVYFFSFILVSSFVLVWVLAKHSTSCRLQNVTANFVSVCSFVSICSFGLVSSFVSVLHSYWFLHSYLSFYHSYLYQFLHSYRFFIPICIRLLICICIGLCCHFYHFVHLFYCFVLFSFIFLFVCSGGITNKIYFFLLLAFANGISTYFLNKVAYHQIS